MQMCRHAKKKRQTDADTFSVKHGRHCAIYSKLRYHLLVRFPDTLRCFNEERWDCGVRRGSCLASLGITAPRRGTAAPNPVYSHMTNHRPKTGELSHTSTLGTNVSPFKMCNKHHASENLQSLNHQTDIQRREYLQRTIFNNSQSKKKKDILNF